MPKNSALKTLSSSISEFPGARAAKIAAIIAIAAVSFARVPAAAADKRPAGRQVEIVTNERYLDAAVNLINSAKKKILVCHFSWNPDTTTSKIKNAIYAAVERGVEVKIILEGRLSQNAYAVKEFDGLHIPVKSSSREWYLHAKMIVVDGKKTLLGSTNLSYKSINENNEANVLVESPEIARLYENFFEEIWADSSKEVKLDAAETPEATAAPNRTYHPIMRRYIANAKKKVALVFYGMRVYPGGHNEVMEFLDELTAAAKRGVEVRVLLEKSGYDERLNEGNRDALLYLASKGVSAHFDTPEKITHAKIILVDDEAAGVGSANFALSGFRFYQEANIVVKEKAAIEELWRYYEELWGNSSAVETPPKKSVKPAKTGAR